MFNLFHSRTERDIEKLITAAKSTGIKILHIDQVNDIITITAQNDDLICFSKRPLRRSIKAALLWIKDRAASKISVL
jgi:hypothetical protein